MGAVPAREEVRLVNAPQIDELVYLVFLFVRMTWRNVTQPKFLLLDNR